MPKPVQNDLAKFNDLMDEVRRLRGEVRRYRRALRKVRKCGCCGRTCDATLETALAPRRRTK